MPGLITALIITVVIIVLVGFNALYVAGEFATVAARKTRIAEMAEAGNPLAKRLIPIMDDPVALDNYVATSQIGITISSLVLGIFGERVIAAGLETSLALSVPLAITLGVIICCSSVLRAPLTFGSAVGVTVGS